MNLLLSKNLPSELSSTNYISSNYPDKLKQLEGVSKVNVFVGANNSGKSRFVRGLLKLQDYILLSSDYIEKLNKVNDLLNIIYNDFPIDGKIGFHYNQNLENPLLKKELILLKSNIKTTANNSIALTFDKDYIKSKIEYFKDFLYIIEKNNIDQLNSELAHFQGVLLLINGILNDYHTVRVHRDYNNISVGISDFVSRIREVISENTLKSADLIGEMLEIGVNILEPKKIYLPTLRSAKTLVANSMKYENLYLDTIKSTHFSESNTFEDKWPSLKIFTGLDFYKEVKKVRNSKRTIRKSFEKFEQFLKKNFFDDKEVDIVALENENHLSFYLDDEDLEIHNLGDGIQALIVLMFPIFTAEKDSWIFIDEPEINLHPGMQRLFLEQILNNPEIKKKELRFFITTHSNHFLDLTISNEDVSIYSFSKLIGNKAKEHKFLIRNVKPGDSSLLSELGVNNSSVFLANCSIWVEGISDRKYLSAFLFAYLKNIKKEYYLKEDVDYAFFEYAGSNLSHYFFFRQIEFRRKRRGKRIN